MLKQQIEADLKQAMLSGDKPLAEILRGLKSAILYEEVAKGARETGLDDAAIETVIAREVKKRIESADLYKKAGADDRATAELAEKEVLAAYLPKQMSDKELAEVVEAVFAELGSDAQMGKVIGAVRQKVGNQADGARIAAAVKNKF